MPFTSKIVPEVFSFFRIVSSDRDMKTSCETAKSMTSDLGNNSNSIGSTPC